MDWKRSRQGAAMVLLCLLSLQLSARSPGDKLIEAPGADLVQAHCSACHSLALVTSQRGDQKFWLKTIRWMQATQNLWVLPPEHEARIVAYLSEHYAQTEWGRRPNLEPRLMPKL
jgi:hypothetical protein